MQISDPQLQTTPEYAGFWLRFAAVIIDYFVLGFIQFVLVVPFLAYLGIVIFTAPADINELSDAEKLGYISAMIGPILLMASVTAIAGWLYYALMESSAKQGTIGKIALGIKVTDMDGQPISFMNATGRYFGKILSSLVMMIGYLMAAFTQKKQALHDILANCLVVKR